MLYETHKVNKETFLLLLLLLYKCNIEDIKIKHNFNCTTANSYSSSNQFI